MSYPADHTPDARDGIEGLLEQIASSVGGITDEASSIEDKLATIAVALRAADAAATAVPTYSGTPFHVSGDIDSGTVVLIEDSEVGTGKKVYVHGFFVSTAGGEWGTNVSIEDTAGTAFAQVTPSTTAINGEWVAGVLLAPIFTGGATGKGLQLQAAAHDNGSITVTIFGIIK